MAGRRRRPSNSTVATADDVRPRYLKESKVIRPITAGPEDWTTFVLEDAIILEKDGVTMANGFDVLNANVKGPYIVRGRLDIDVTDPEQRDQLSRLLKPRYKSAEIEIRNSNDKSIGYGPLPVLWMSGASAWFEINPCAAYKPIYDSSCRAITLYYAIMTIYEGVGGGKKAKSRRKLTANLPIDELFFKYATTVGDGIVLDEVYKQCDDHARFLLSQFLKEDINSFDWREMSFCTWMQERHPKLQQEVVEATTNPKPPAPVASPDISSQDDDEEVAQSGASRRAYRSHSDEDTVMEDAPLRKTLSMRGKPPARATATPPAESSSRRGKLVRSSPALEEAGDAFLMFLRLVEDIGDESDMNRVKATTIQSKIYQRCKIRNYHSMKEVTSYFAQGLLDNLSPRWRPSPLWEELQELAANSHGQYQLLKLETLPHQFQLRNKNPTFIPRSTAGKAALAEEAESDPPARKGIKNPRGRPAGKLAALRLAGSSKKRIVDEDEDEDSGRARKNAKTSHHHSVEEDEEEEEEVGSSDDEAATRTAKPLAGVSAPQPSQNVGVVVRAVFLPSMSPKGPNGTWKCQEEGCGHIVRGADEQEGKDLIQAHFEAHAASAARIDLAMAEGSKGNQQISHLLDKIRKLGEENQEEKKIYIVHANGEKKLVPQPIKRRLLV